MTKQTHASHLVPCISSTTNGGEPVIEHEFKYDPADTVYPLLKSVFDAVEAVEPIPVLDVSHGGNTGYIDFVQHEDMPGKFAKGACPNGRPFWAIRVQRDYGSIRDLPNGADWVADDDRYEQGVIVIHRRYLEGSTWVIAGERIKDVFGALTPRMVEIIKELVVKGEYKDIELI